ncbi:alginate O-acetyltransferase AlgX-related protein [Salinicola avicenniae]|uniref:alginate O-acetyltransferase AlgX-related protein n=1 Tax=Salinicola avicenniae TaxID=2916836 RepID=UPI00207365C8|nr:MULTISPECIES: hypothetical protein [unclassified Salinicola]
MQNPTLTERGPAATGSTDAAAAALARGEFETVLAQLEPSYRAGADSAEILLLLIRAYAGLGRSDERRAVLAQALQKYPDKLEFRVADAEFAMARQDWTAAIERWQRIETSFREFPSAVHLRHARACLAASDFDAALRAVDAALERQSDNATARDLRDVIASRKARKYQIADQALAAPSLLSWTPAEAQRRIATLSAFRQCQIQVALDSSATEAALLLIRTGDEVETRPLHPSVEDAAQVVLTLDLTRPVELGVSQAGEAHWCVKLSLSPVMEVIQGKDGWLFLANDSNASVDQFTGRKRLEAEQRQQWRTFATALSALQRRRSVLFLIANSKEKVRPERYPHQQAAVTPTEQVEAILQAAGAAYCNPIKAMQAAPASYYATDTHWSGLGAFLAFQSCMRRFGYQDHFESLFAFHEQEVVGDLGSKLDPPARTRMTVATYQGGSQTRCLFTNAIPGTGNITIFENARPRHARTLVIFGGSSSGAGGFANLFAAIFRRVVVINLPGSYIHEVVDREQADHVIIQTNERYLPSPGSVRETLSEMTTDIQRHRLSEAQRAKLRERIQHQGPCAPYDTFMAQALR